MAAESVASASPSAPVLGANVVSGLLSWLEAADSERATPPALAPPRTLLRLPPGTCPRWYSRLRFIAALSTPSAVGSTSPVLGAAWRGAQPVLCTLRMFFAILPMSRFHQKYRCSFAKSMDCPPSPLPSLVADRYSRRVEHVSADEAMMRIVSFDTASARIH